uniref:Uncharacterized protein n=1 Tax=Timema poppense TaxID=170557 RepID=A0A7R9DIS4_TIMPO|nr:unnamed protein product [Timema poppensis]
MDRKSRGLETFFSGFILVMGVLAPLTSGVVSSAAVAFVYRASNFKMTPLYAILWGVQEKWIDTYKRGDKPNMAFTMKRRTQFTLYTAANGQRVLYLNNFYSSITNGRSIYHVSFALSNDNTTGYAENISSRVSALS